MAVLKLIRKNLRPVAFIAAGVVVALAASVGGSLGIRQYARIQLQDVADDAALVAVRALRDGNGDNATQSHQAVAAATHAAAGRIGTARISVAASVSPILVSVTISDASSRLSRVAGGIEVVANAGYAPPAEESRNTTPLYNRLKPTITTARSQW